MCKLKKKKHEERDHCSGFHVMSDANYLLLLSKEALFYRTLSILLITKRRNFLNLDCAGILLRFYATSCCQLIYHRTAFLHNYINLLYRVIYGVIQGFPALRKIKYFYMCVWYRQSAADRSLAFRATWSGWWMNSKAFTTLNPWMFVGIFSKKYHGC